MSDHCSRIESFLWYDHSAAGVFLEYWLRCKVLFVLMDGVIIWIFYWVHPYCVRMTQCSIEWAQTVTTTPKLNGCTNYCNSSYTTWGNVNMGCWEYMQFTSVLTAIQTEMVLPFRRTCKSPNAILFDTTFANMSAGIALCENNLSSRANYTDACLYIYTNITHLQRQHI